LPVPAQVAKKLAAVNRSGIGASGVVVLAPDGSVLASRSADKPLAPASTMKLLTSLAALDTLGADHTFTTRVVRSGTRIVLVGGGDPLLTDKQSRSAAKPASLQVLATATVAALTSAGVKRVQLGYDTSLFSGPAFNPAWKAKWQTWVARVSPLLISSGRFNQWQADPAPARTAATAFAKRLKAAGITVTRVLSARADASAAELASVQSAPLSTVVGRTLTYSDNLAAEVIARHVALAAGNPASFTGGAAGIKAWLTARSLWSDGMRVVDGSGLALAARVTPTVLAKAVLASLDTPALAGVAAGLPVAGLSGTLKDRFDDKSEKVARGNVHAKTGTLVGVAALAGYLTTADGARLVFAIIANRTRGQTTAYNWLDRSTAVLVRCGCR
ncbi:MAG TPA: D-alanyl-D-alanine carboxypeptidase/D-alanyl-D-alanine-endopeptidase, partial [Propionicimonas sp.]|nr:D-alanyl-D-alanine carboxypeptidase/D-alanyl-D-alanine-endopeptidase [Propionicimonas sp.]